MTEFLPLILLLAAFVAVHTAISRPRIRDPLIARLGRRWYGALHGLVSTVGMVAVFWAFYMAPYLELWSPLAAFRGGRNPFTHDHAELERRYRVHHIAGPYLVQIYHGDNVSSRRPPWYLRRLPLERLEEFGIR